MSEEEKSIDEIENDEDSIEEDGEEEEEEEEEEVEKVNYKSHYLPKQLILNTEKIYKMK